MFAERLSYNPLYSVARCRVSTLLLRNRETELGNTAAAWSAQNCKPIVPAAACFLEHATESGCVEKPITFSKPVRRAASEFGLFIRRRDDRP
jgi:hypothetical protein